MEMGDWCNAANNVDERPVLCESSTDILKSVELSDGQDNVHKPEPSLCHRSLTQENPDEITVGQDADQKSHPAAEKVRPMRTRMGFKLSSRSIN